MASLVNGIIQDAQNLIREEVALAKQEIKEEVTKVRTVALAAGAGLVITVLGSVLLSFFLVHLLHWATGGTDTASVPLWAWFLIFGVIFFAIGGALFALAYTRLRDIHFVPRQTVETMKENVQWIKNQT
jgi:pheromone shutdown protein TraB